MATQLIQSASELESAIESLSAGDTLYIEKPATPYVINQWLDIDVSQVTLIGEDVFAADGNPILKAGSDDHGGIRIGNGASVSNVRLVNLGYDGDRVNRNTSGTNKYLHAFVVDQADNVQIERCYATGTTPYHEHDSGGSGFSVTNNASHVNLLDCWTDDIGDRAMQLGGDHIYVRNFWTRNGFDRSISMDMTDDGGSVRGASDVTVDGGDFADNVEGSCIVCNDVASNNVIIKNIRCTGQFRGAVQADNADCERWSITGVSTEQTAEDTSQSHILLRGSGHTVAGCSLKVGQGSSKPVVGLNGATDCVISGNTIEHVQCSGLQLFNNASKRIKIVGNIFTRPSPNNGQGVDIDSGMSEIEVDNNRFYNYGNGSGGQAALLNKSSDGIRVNRNIGETSSGGGQSRAFIASDSGAPFAQCEGNINLTPSEVTIDTTGGVPALLAGNVPTDRNTVTIADDAAHSFAPTFSKGKIRVNDGNGEVAEILFDIANSTITEVADLNGNVETSTTGLTGSDGTDAKLSVGIDSANGELDIENRLGGSRDVRFEISY